MYTCSINIFVFSLIWRNKNSYSRYLRVFLGLKSRDMYIFSFWKIVTLVGNWDKMQNLWMSTVVWKLQQFWAFILKYQILTYKWTDCFVYFIFMSFWGFSLNKLGKNTHSYLCKWDMISAPYRPTGYPGL